MQSSFYLFIFLGSYTINNDSAHGYILYTGVSNGWLYIHSVASLCGYHTCFKVKIGTPTHDWRKAD